MICRYITDTAELFFMQPLIALREKNAKDNSGAPNSDLLREVPKLDSVKEPSKSDLPKEAPKSDTLKAQPVSRYGICVFRSLPKYLFYSLYSQNHLKSHQKRYHNTDAYHVLRACSRNTPRPHYMYHQSLWRIRVPA